MGRNLKFWRNRSSPGTLERLEIYVNFEDMRQFFFSLVTTWQIQFIPNKCYMCLLGPERIRSGRASLKNNKNKKSHSVRPKSHLHNKGAPNVVKDCFSSRRPGHFPCALKVVRSLKPWLQSSLRQCLLRKAAQGIRKCCN